MKKKIYFLINSFASGGAERVLSLIVNELVKTYQVEVFLLEKNHFYTIDKNIKITYLSDYTGNENGIKKLLSIPLFSFKLRKYIKKSDIKLIQSHAYRANYVNIFSKILGAGHKVQIVNHGMVSRYLEEGIKGRLNLLLIKLLYKKADLIIWVSKMMKKDANLFINLINKQIVINNPLDLKNINIIKNNEVTNFKFDNNKKYLVSVGSLLGLKRNRDLIKALKLLDNNVEVIFIGDGDEKESLIAFAKEIKVFERVNFLGTVNNPFKYLEKCDIFVHTSETEGFPNVLIEAMACGLPVVSSDCIAGPREILAPDTDYEYQLKNDIEIAEYGILFPVGDVERLVESINTLLQNSVLQNNYRKKNIERAKDFSLERIVHEYKYYIDIEID